ncbi:MAG: hypothetical protein IJP27_09275, partial [Clostridia bacterium]|nr:hypothetical protein [Clostridia bacterium]
MEMVQLKLPMGYHLMEERIVLPLEQAQQLLLSRKQRTVTEAERDDYQVTIKRHYIQCPCCYHRIYAYARSFNKAFGNELCPDKRVEQGRVLDWSSQQLTLLDRERSPLQFNSVVDVKGELTCPNCKNKMQHSERVRQVELRQSNHTISVYVEVMEAMELFSSPCLSGSDLQVEFPLFEVACFNFKNGRTYVRLEASDGRVLAIRDLSFNKYAWIAGAVHRAVTKNKKVQRTLRDLFSREWQSKLPFYPSELGVDELRMLTMFVGYSRAFYSAIPFERESFAVEASFEAQAMKMRNASQLVSLYERSQLPNMKSVKKVFFENEGLFFYLEECERLWALFQNPNHFVSLLKGARIYQKLSDLHMRPLIFDFLQDYLKIGTPKHLLKLFKNYWCTICRYAVNYGSMSKQMRKTERERWKKHKKGSVIGSLPNFSIPLCSPTERIRNCSIDEFEFSWLKTSADYEEAGRQLNNCLRDWSPDCYPVVCVRKQGKIVAALEVRGDCIFQARSSNNESLKK